MNKRAKKKGYYSSEKENSSFQQLKTYGVSTETGRGCPSLVINGDVSRNFPFYFVICIFSGLRTVLVYYSAPTDAGVRAESPPPDYKQTPESAPRRIELHVGIGLIVGVIVIAFIASILLSNSFLGPKVGITGSVLRKGSGFLTRVGYLLM